MDRFIFDLDGTVTREELLPRIARAFGVSNQIDDLTRRTIRGDMPFEVSLAERVGILGNFPVSEVQQIVAGVELDPHILEFIRQNRTRCAIVTGNLDVWLAQLSALIPAPIIGSRAAVNDNRVQALIDIMDKRRVSTLFPGERLCVIGEGHNDLGMFEAADISVAFGAVHPPASSLMDVSSHAAFDGRTLCRFLSQL